MQNKLLELNDVAVRFHTREGTVHAVNGVSYSIAEGETLGIVGESGCGKSVSMLSVMRLLLEPPAQIEGGGYLLPGERPVGIFKS